MVVDGKYVVVLDATWGRQKAELELRTHGSELSGTLIGAMDLKFGNGVVSGNNLSWTMEGQIAKIYPEIVRWKCTATLDGDKITGYATVSGDIGDAPFHGTRAGKGGEAEVALPWTDLGLPRYEAISVEWVKAFGEWIGARFEGQTLDFDYRWSIELTDPPKHLLRDDGRSSIGWHYIVKDGKFTFGDGPLEGNLDFGGHAIPYASQVKRMRLTTDQLVEQQERNPPPGPLPGEKQTRLDQTEEFRYKMKRMNELISGPGNVMREEFWSQRTL